MKEWLEYAAVWLIGWGLGLWPRLQKTAEINLRLAFPEWTDAQRRSVIGGMLRHLGWMAVEFARFPTYTRQNIEQMIVLDGHENFLEGQGRGKGVLYLTGHIGAWELSSFAHALYGFPLHYLARPIENRRIDGLVNGYRCLSGNQPIFKNESARVTIKVLKDAGTIGIQNLDRNARRFILEDRLIPRQA